MTKMRWLLVLLALPALGAELQFEGEPHLAGTFKVVVTGVAATSGQATLVVLRTGEVIRVDLRCEEGRLASPPIHARRPCDPDGDPSLSVELGDTVVAATDLGGGLSRTALVAAREPGVPALAFERWDNVDMEWVPAEEVGPALFRFVVADRSLDTTCARDPVALSVTIGGEEFSLPLVEDAPASGAFVVEFVVALEPQDGALWLELVTVEGDLLAAVPVEGGTYVVGRHGAETRQVPFAPLSVTLEPSDLALPVGCVGEVRVTEPAGADEVRWWVDGVARSGGLGLPLFADAPRSASVVALVRQGLLWGRAETEVTFVPRVRLSFVDATTGARPTEPWPCSLEILVRADGATGPVEVMVGRLGPDPRVQTLTLASDVDGAFVSAAIRPADLGACAGEVLWAQFRDPRGCYTAYITLPLR
ncbi:hypothetical protein H5T55_02115 [Candidatus Bipolaricaulota bacterium]|nr:hypothetical protein [Candidatus Bipolaricaulota bacterium]